MHSINKEFVKFRDSLGLDDCLNSISLN